MGTNPWSLVGRAPKTEQLPDGSVVIHIDFPESGAPASDEELVSDKVVGDFVFGKFGDKDRQKYYFGGQDPHGHEFEIRCKTDKRLGGLVGRIVESYKTPYRYGSDFLRNAVYQQVLVDLPYVEEAEDLVEIMADLEADREAAERLEMLRVKQKTIASCVEVLTQAKSAKDWTVFRAQLEAAEKIMQRWHEPWTSQMRKVIDEWAHFLPANSV